MKSLPGYTLFLGAGNSNFRSPRVIEVEHDLFRDTDVVADAHRLPFRSSSFDLFFVADFWRHHAGWNPEAHAIFTALPEPAQRATAAGFDVRARKPS